MVTLLQPGYYYCNILVCCRNRWHSDAIGPPANGSHAIGLSITGLLAIGLPAISLPVIGLFVSKGMEAHEETCPH